MLAEIKDFVKAHFNDIILFIIVALLIMLTFSAGYIIAKYQAKPPIELKNFNQTEIQ